jgi:hypothetical protein
MQPHMNTWNLMRSREQGCQRTRVTLNRHFYDQDLKDVMIEDENAERMWWNSVLAPKRSCFLRTRAILIRKCQNEINVQRRNNNRTKRKRNDTDVEIIYDEIVIS